MRIDWAQTLIGLHQGFDDHQDPSSRLGYAMRLGRIAGIVASMTLLCLGMAVLPFLAPEATLNYGLVFSGSLLAHAVGFVLLLRASPDHPCLPGLSNVLAIPFMTMAGVSTGMILAFAGLLLCEVVWQNRVRRSQEAANWFLPLCCIGIVLLARPETGLESVVILCALLPFSITLVALLPKRRGRNMPSGVRDRKAQALLKVALERLPGTQLLCNIMGVIMPDHAGTQAGFNADDGEFGPSLMDAVLIVDRPPLLQALSRAVHAGEASAPFHIRLRGCSTSDAGTGFVPHLCRVVPAEGVHAHAIVVLEPVAEERGSACIAETQLASGLHDAVSPFNAGLGYLEMLCDPALALDDIGTIRHYAGNARNAVQAAHRNNVLMGRWLRLMQRKTAEPARALSLMALLNDAMRALNLAQDESGLLIRGEREALVMIDEDAARFAVMVLLRGGLVNHRHGTGLCLDVAAVPEGVRLSLSLDEAPQADMFQSALEEAVTGFGTFRFERAADHVAMTIRPLAMAGGVHRLGAGKAASSRIERPHRVSRPSNGRMKSA